MFDIIASIYHRIKCNDKEEKFIEKLLFIVQSIFFYH